MQRSKMKLDYRPLLHQNPVILVLRVTAVSVGRFAHVLPTGSSLPQTDTDFLAGITGIPLVEQITDCGEALAVSRLLSTPSFIAIKRTS